MSTKEEYRELLKVYFKTMNVACWVDVLSEHQIASINRLAHALRDDNLQGTSFRVRKLLQQIGIVPAMSTQQLRVYIDLSRGSDLAFLYFILEGHYKSHGSCENLTRNEKLLMTAIMKLDLAFTIEALDKILPIYTPKPKVELEEVMPPPLNVKPKIRLNHCQIQAKMTNKGSPLFNPYFQKIKRPKRILIKTKCPVPNFRTKVQPRSFPHQDRWFAKYELQPTLRLVQNCLKQAVDCLLENPEFPQITDEKALCETHKHLQKESNLIKDALIVAARNRCLHLLNVSGRQDKARIVRIVKQLENDIDWYTSKYKNIRKLQLTPTKMMRTNCNQTCDMCRALVTTLGEQLDMCVWYWGDNIEHAATVATDTVKTISGPNAVFKEVLDAEGIDPETSQKPFKIKKRCKYSCLSGPVKRLLSVLNGCRLPEKIHKNEIPPIEIVKLHHKPTPQYFKAQTTHTAHSFYYMDIFPTKEKIPQYQRTINKALTNALRENPINIIDSKLINQARNCNSSQPLEPCAEQRPVRKSKRNRSGHQGLSISSSSSSMIENDFIHSDQYRNRKVKMMNKIIDCVENICQNMFEDAREVAEEESRLKIEKKKGMHLEFERLEYKHIEYFDPDDEDLMFRLLFDGMKLLKKDRRFVLASLPDSHKLFDLLEWAKRRYGKSYTFHELTENFRTSLPVFRAVIKLQDRPPLVQFEDMPVGDLSYFKHNEMMRISESIKKAYADKTNRELFSNLKFIWFALGGYLCARGPPKDLFNAYFPAKESDIYRVKLWKGEHRDFKQFLSARRKHEAKTIKL